MKISEDNQNHRSQKLFYFLSALTAAGAVLYGCRKKSLHTSFIVIIFNLWPFNISEDILRNKKFNTAFNCFFAILPSVCSWLNLTQPSIA